MIASFRRIAIAVLPILALAAGGAADAASPTGAGAPATATPTAAAAPAPAAIPATAAPTPAVPMPRPAPVPPSGTAPADGAAPVAATAPTGEAPFRPLFFDRNVRPQKPAGDASAIRFLTTGDFPPFSFLDPTGRLMGYDVDLAQMICDTLEVGCTIQMRPFGDLVTALAEKRGDAIVAGLAVGPELRDRLDTSDAYLTTPGRFVRVKDDPVEATPEGLAGRWISVVSGSAHEAYVLDHFPQARVAAYPDETSARDALRDHKVAVHFGDAVGLAFWLDGTAGRGCCDFAGHAYLETAYFGEGLRIAVAKNNPRLRRNLDYALRRLAADGRLGELYLRWFPRGYY